MELKNSSKLWTKSFITLSLCSFLLFLNLQLLLSSFPAYVKDKFLAGDVTVSLVTSVFAISAIATRFLTAYLIRKIHRNVILYIGLIIAALTTAVYVIASTIGSLLLLRVGYGIGFGMASTIIPTLVSQIIPSKRLGEGIGYFSLSTSLALSIGPLIGLNLMQQFGFRTLSIVGALTVIIIFPLIFMTKSIPPEPAKIVHSTAAKQRFNFKLLFPASLNMILAITYSGLLSFIALYGKSVSLDQVGLFFLFNAVTVVIIRPISGRLFDRKGHGAILLPSAVCVIASLVVLSFTTTIPMLIVSALLYGLGFGAIQPTIQAWMLRISTKEQHGMANSMFYNSTDLGVALGALLLGAIASLSSYAIMYRYAAGFMVLFAVVYMLVNRNTAAKQQAVMLKTASTVTASNVSGNGH